MWKPNGPYTFGQTFFFIATKICVLEGCPRVSSCRSQRLIVSKLHYCGRRHEMASAHCCFPFPFLSFPLYVRIYLVYIPYSYQFIYLVDVISSFFSSFSPYSFFPFLTILIVSLNLSTVVCGPVYVLTFVSRTLAWHSTCLANLHTAFAMFFLYLIVFDRRASI